MSKLCENKTTCDTVRKNRRDHQEWTIQCTVNTLTTPYGIPIEAQFIKSASIGATGLPGESITVDHWSSTDGNNKYYGTVSSPGCYPIEYTFYSTSLITMTFVDIKTVITDPDVFIPP